MDLKIEELERKEARMVMNGADFAVIHEELNKEGEALAKKKWMNMLSSLFQRITIMY